MNPENTKPQGQNRKPESQQAPRKTDQQYSQHTQQQQQPRSQQQQQEQQQPPQHQSQHTQQQPQQSHIPKNSVVSVDRLRGLVVHVKTQLGDEATGHVYLYNPAANVLVLQTLSKNSPSAVPGLPPPTPLYDFRIIKISILTEVTPVNSSTHEQWSPMRGPPLEPINVNKILSKENASLRDHTKNLMRIGVGVSQEGQDLFDALSRTLPCRWAQDSIVVMDEVIIHAPYHANNCKTNNPSGGSLARVQKVLDGERRRLGFA